MPWCVGLVGRNYLFSLKVVPYSRINEIQEKGYDSAPTSVAVGFNSSEIISLSKTATGGRRAHRHRARLGGDSEVLPVPAHRSDGISSVSPGVPAVRRDRGSFRRLDRRGRRRWVNQQASTSSPSGLLFRSSFSSFVTVFSISRSPACVDAFSWRMTVYASSSNPESPEPLLAFGASGEQICERKESDRLFCCDPGKGAGITFPSSCFRFWFSFLTRDRVIYFCLFSASGAKLSRFFRLLLYLSSQFLKDGAADALVLAFLCVSSLCFWNM